MTDMSCFMVGEWVHVVIVARYLNSIFIGFIVICLIIKGK